MNKSRSIDGKLPFVGIQTTPSYNVLSDTHENEKNRQPVIGIEGLRAINRIVRAIKSRIEPDPLPVK